MATIIYNGYTGLQHVTFDSYDMQPVFAEDGISQVTTKHELTGSAVIAEDTDAAFTTELLEASQKLTKPMATLVINLIGGGGAGTELVNITPPDDHGGPQARFRINKVIGCRAALVTFTVTWWKFEEDGEDIQSVLSHRWTQQFVNDANDMVTHVVTGSLTVRASATATPAGVVNVGNNPDAYRLAVVPLLPTGFRRESMEFATDETGNKLLYTVTSKQYARDLPAPARTGNASFSYRQAIDGGGAGLLGMKVFEAEFVGSVRYPPQSASPGTQPPNVHASQQILADLLVAAVRVSARFIKYTGIEGDLVRSIEVTVMDMFTDNRIRFRVTAQGTGGTGSGDGDGFSGVGILSPPNVNLLQDFMEGIPGYQDTSPYGSALIRAVRRQLYTPTTAIIPKAQTESMEGAAGQIPTTSYVVPTNQLATIEKSIIPASETNPEGPTTEHRQYPYTWINCTDRIQVADSGMRRIPAQSLNGNDRVMQVRKPLVYLIQEMELKRLNMRPDTSSHLPPAGAILREMDMPATTNSLDANANIEFTTTARRVWELVDIPQGVAMWLTSVAPGSFGFEYRSFFPPDGLIARPWDPRSDIESSVPVIGPGAPHQFFFSNGSDNGYFGDADQA